MRCHKQQLLQRHPTSSHNMYLFGTTTNKTNINYPKMSHSFKHEHYIMSSIECNVTNVPKDPFILELRPEVVKVTVTQK